MRPMWPVRGRVTALEICTYVHTYSYQPSRKRKRKATMDTSPGYHPIWLRGPSLREGTRRPLLSAFDRDMSGWNCGSYHATTKLLKRLFLEELSKGVPASIVTLSTPILVSAVAHILVANPTVHSAFSTRRNAFILVDHTQLTFAH